MTDNNQRQFPKNIRNVWFDDIALTHKLALKPIAARLFNVGLLHDAVHHYPASMRVAATFVYHWGHGSDAWPVEYACIDLP